MEMFFNRWEKEGMKKGYGNPGSQNHSLETVKNIKSEDQLKGNLLTEAVPGVWG